MKFNIEVEITNEQIENLIVSAFEGGSSYWMVYDVNPIIKDFKWNSSEYAAQIINGDVEINVYDAENPDDLLGRLNTHTILTGLKTMCKDYPTHFTDIINDNIDADTGDVFMQCAVMNDVVFG